jgi:hypothetical protein
LADGPSFRARVDATPVLDGLIAANGWLFLSATDGCMVCLGGE